MIIDILLMEDVLLSLDTMILEFKLLLSVQVHALLVHQVLYVLLAGVILFKQEH